MTAAPAAIAQAAALPAPRRVAAIHARADVRRDPRHPVVHCERFPPGFRRAPVMTALLSQPLRGLRRPRVNAYPDALPRSLRDRAALPALQKSLGRCSAIAVEPEPNPGAP